MEDTENLNLPEQKPTSRNLPGNKCQDRETQTIIDKFLEVRCGQVWELKTLGGPSHQRAPRFLWVVPPGTHALMLPVGKSEKEPFWNMLPYSVLNKALPQEKLFYNSLTYLGEGKYSTPVSNNLPWGRRDLHNSSLLQLIYPT